MVKAQGWGKRNQPGANLPHCARKQQQCNKSPPCHQSLNSHVFPMKGLGEGLDVPVSIQMKWRESRDGKSSKCVFASVCVSREGYVSHQRAAVNTEWVILQRVTGALKMSLPGHVPFQENASCHVFTHKLRNQLHITKKKKNTSFHSRLSGISGWKMHFWDRIEAEQLQAHVHNHFKLFSSVP